MAFTHPLWLLAGVGVGICSSVVPCLSDQLAMARLPRATFAMMLSLLPAMATVIGVAVLARRPTARDLAGIVLVTAGVAVRQEQHAAADTGTRADAGSKVGARTGRRTPDHETRT